MIVIITSIIDQWKVGSLSGTCYTLRGRQLELYAGMFHLISLSVLPHTFKFHIFGSCEEAFVDNFTQETDAKRKFYARDAYFHAALNFCVTCLMQDLRSNSGVLSRTVSIGSKQSDTERHVRFAEPACSFVGMHCIFDNCKASGFFL